MTLIRIFMLALLLLASVVVTFAQSGQAGKSTAPPDPTVTVSISAKGVRFAALGSIGQMRLEVFNSSGDPLYNSEFQAGNLRDWALEDKIGQPLPDGSYLCVVTIRDVSGRLGMKQGTVLVQGGQPSLKLGEGQQVGAVEPEKVLAPVSDGNATAVTLMAHDGTEGQIVRGKGALSFRIGDFFSGKDSEQMRLTAEGNLGIGITHPQARLEVDGVIRASQGILFPDGTTQLSAASKTLGAKSTRPDQNTRNTGSNGELQTQAAGTGTQNFIAKWTDNLGNLGNSIIFETSNNVGIGTTFPGAKLQVASDPNGGMRISSASGTDVPSVDFITSSTYQGTFGVAAATNQILTGSAVGDFSLRSQNNLLFGAAGAEKMRLTSSGNVGIGTTAPGAILEVNRANDSGKILRLGNLTVGFDFARSAVTGALSIQGDQAGSNNIVLAPTSGNLGIGTTNPQAKLDVAGDILVSGNIAAKYQDVAEWVPASQKLAAGTVVTLDVTRSNTVTPSTRPYDPHIAGVVSSQPGLTLGEGGPGKILVATTGRVRVKVDATRRAIKVGDLLVTSDKSGLAMKSLPIRVAGTLMHRPGTIIGKALEPLANGKGEILVLLSLQ